MENMKRNSNHYLLLTLGLLAGFGPFVTDFYLPSFPMIAEFYKTSASMTQASLSSGMIGLAVGQLFVGPLSDKYGRKTPLLCSLILFVLATFLCLFSPDIHVFIVARLLQGLAASGGVVISRSVAADLFEGRQLTRFFSLLAIVILLGTIFAPVCGGILLNFTNWKGIFWALVVLGVFLFILNTWLHETHALDKRVQGNIFASFKSFAPIFSNRIFMLIVLMQSVAQGVFFAYISASPFIFQKIYGISPLTFSILFGINAVGLMIGSRLIVLFPERKALGLSSLIVAIGSLILGMFFILQVSLILVEICLFLILVMMGIILPLTTSLAMRAERKSRGGASAILGFFPFFVGSIITPLVGLGNILLPTSVTIIVCGVVSFLFTRVILKGGELGDTL